MDRWKSRVALVTGASVGIGAEICRDLVKNGMVVLGCARRVELIQATAEELKGQPGVLHPYKCDLTKEDEIMAMFDYIHKNLGGVDVLVNNAGRVNGELLLDGNTSTWRELLDLNVLACAICARESIKSMKSRGVDDGHLIFISSVVGRVMPESLPKLHFYSATKFAVSALAEGFRQELVNAKSHIRLTTICPGIVETEILSQYIPKEHRTPEFNLFKPIYPAEVSQVVVHCLTQPQRSSISDVLIRPTEEML